MKNISAYLKDATILISDRLRIKYIMAFKIRARVVPHNSEKHHGVSLDNPGYHTALTAPKKEYGHLAQIVLYLQFCIRWTLSHYSKCKVQLLRSWTSSIVSFLSKMSSCLYFKTQRFDGWILSLSSGKTYSAGSNRQS
jgi:hypothetical protein